MSSTIGNASVMTDTVASTCQLATSQATAGARVNVTVSRPCVLTVQSSTPAVSHTLTTRPTNNRLPLVTLQFLLYLL